MTDKSDDYAVQLEKPPLQPNLPPAELVWKNITYVRKGKTLLNNISGSICGQTMAIMG